MIARDSCTRIAGVMAAGHGRRLAQHGTCKPLVRVAGVPLIDHVLNQCLSASIDTVVVAIRDDDRALTEHLAAERRFSSGVHVVSVETGGGTGTALHTLVTNIGPRPCLISTADTIARPGAYERLIDFAYTLPPEHVGVVLATRYVRDEDPIWIRCDDRTRLRTLSKGIEPTGLIFGNVRWLSAAGATRLAAMDVRKGMRDTLMMTALLDDPSCDIRVFVDDPVFDIDDPDDVEAAEEWLQSMVAPSRSERESD